MGEKYAAKDNTIQPFRLCLGAIFLSCLCISHSSGKAVFYILLKFMKHYILYKNLYFILYTTSNFI